MSTAVKYHLSRNGTVGPCEASAKPCPLGGAHYASKEEATFELMSIGAIRNHSLQMPSDGVGYHCACGWEPDAPFNFDGLFDVEEHAESAHREEVSEAKAALDSATTQNPQAKTEDRYPYIGGLSPVARSGAASDLAAEIEGALARSGPINAVTAADRLAAILQTSRSNVQIALGYARLDFEGSKLSVKPSAVQKPEAPTFSFNRFDGSWIGEFSKDPRYAYGILQKEGGQIRNMTLEDARLHAQAAENIDEYVVKYDADGEIDEGWDDQPASVFNGDGSLSKPYSEMSTEEKLSVQKADREALNAVVRQMRDNPTPEQARVKREQDAALKRAEDEYRARGYNQI